MSLFWVRLCISVCIPRAHSTASWIQILLPAICLHGTYDFVLFAIGGLSSVYGLESLALNTLSIALPLVITLGGIYWAYVSFKQVHTSTERIFNAYLIRFLFRFLQVQVAAGRLYRVAKMQPPVTTNCEEIGQGLYSTFYRRNCATNYNLPKARPIICQIEQIFSKQILKF